MAEARKAISWILKFTSKTLDSDEERIKCLRSNGNEAVKTVLRYAFNPDVVWELPEGDPPYVPCEFPHQESRLYQEARRLYLFVEGGSPNLNQVRRERMFVELLESIQPEDAKMLLLIKDGKLTKHEDYKNLSKKLVLRAFPGLF